MLETLIDQSPPRRLPPGVMTRLARTNDAGAIWVMIALVCFGLFYGMLFTALRAPAVIRIAFAAPIGLALLIFIWWWYRLHVRARLIANGIIVTGQLRIPEKIPRGLDGVVTISYEFTTRDGLVQKGESAVVWRSGFADLEVAPVCYDRERPSRNLCLLALAD